MQNIRLPFCLIIMCLSIWSSQCYTQNITPQNTQVLPSPSASSLIKGAQSKPNLYTGAVSMYVPLFSVPTNAMDIPIALKYQSNGVKINDSNGILGITWNLQGGGAVARVVNGYPDEFNGKIIKKAIKNEHKIYGNPIMSITETPQKAKEKSIKIIGRWNVHPYKDFDTDKDQFEKMIKKIAQDDEEIWDGQADCYYFAAPGINGKFYITNPQSKPVVHCDQKIELTPHFNNNKIDGFFILTQNGTGYEFGSSPDYWESQSFKTITKSIKSKQKKTRKFFYELLPMVDLDSDETTIWQLNDSDAYRSVWHLKKIILPFKKDVINYQYYKSPDYTILQEKKAIITLDASLTNAKPCGDEGIEICIIPINKDYLTQTANFSRVYTKTFRPKHLLKITSSSGIIKLRYNTNKFTNTPLLENITLLTSTNKILKSFSFDYNKTKTIFGETTDKVNFGFIPQNGRDPKRFYFNTLLNKYEDTTQIIKDKTRFFLKNINELASDGSDSINILSINYHEPQMLPQRCSQNQNHHGYTASFQDLKAHFYSSGIIERTYRYLALIFRKNDKNHNITYPTQPFGLITSTKNPMGAVTSYLYNTFSTGSTLKQIITKNKSEILSKTSYKYENGSSPSGTVGRDYFTSSKIFNISAWGHEYKRLTQGSPIGFGKVTVTSPNQKKEYTLITSKNYNNTKPKSYYQKEKLTKIQCHRRHENHSGDNPEFYNPNEFETYIKSYRGLYEAIIRPYGVSYGKTSFNFNNLTHLKYAQEYINYIKQIGRNKLTINLNLTDDGIHYDNNTSNAAPYKDQDHLRGRIKNIKTFSHKGILLNEEIYNYSKCNIIKAKPLQGSFYVSFSLSTLNDNKIYLSLSNLDYYTLRLNSITKNKYPCDNIILKSETKFSDFASFNPLLPTKTTKINCTTNDTTTVITKYISTIANSKESSSSKTKNAQDPGWDQTNDPSSDFNNKNKYNLRFCPKYIPVKQSTFLNGALFSASKIEYNDPIPYPKSISQWINNKYERTKTFQLYNSKGDLIQYMDKDSVPVAIRYNDHKPVVIAKNATYKQIKDEKPQVLRKQLPEARITSCTYSPNGLVLSKTDPRGETINYKYDKFNRLVFISDKHNNGLKAYKYQYGTTEAETIKGKLKGIGEMVLGETFRVGGFREESYQGKNARGNNYISSFLFTQDKVTFDGKYKTPFAHIKTEYHDGLGRNIQEITQNSLPDGYISLQGIKYDSLGGTSTSFRPLYMLSNSQYNKNWKSNLSQQYPNCDSAFAVYDDRGRIKEKGSLGAAYQPGKGHAPIFSYSMNQQDEKGWESKIGSQNFTTKVYPAGSLFITSTTHEGINISVAKDMKGQVIYKKQGIFITRYAYDLHGNLRAIIPTLASDINDKRYVYQFHYDNRNRLYKKIIPGAGIITVEYDKKDRPYSETDSNGNISYIKYDKLSRPIEMGIVTPNENLPLKILHYDNYNFDFAKQQNAPKNHAQINLDCLTGTELRILGTNKWIKSVTYYNDKSQPTEIITQNNAGGIDRKVILYDFEGKVINTNLEKDFNNKIYSINRIFSYNIDGSLNKMQHQINKDNSITLSNLEYNPNGSLAIKRLHNSTLSSQYKYDQLNRLVEISHDKYYSQKLAYDTPLSGTQNTPYFDGKLSAISWNTKNHPNQWSSFKYNNRKNLTQTLSKDNRYNTAYQYFSHGNIASLKRFDEKGLLQNFQYKYSGNQLISLERTNTEKVDIWPGDANNDGKVEVDDQHPIGYNFLTKITPRKHPGSLWKAYSTYRRKGDNTVFADTDGNGIINEQDTLSIHYHLLKEHTLTPPTPTEPFTYQYDANGNMIYDEYKDMTIHYNHLNLPDTITAVGRGRLINVYLADGTLIRRSILDTNNNEIKRIDYQGELLFVNDTLNKIFHEEGYVVPLAANNQKKSQSFMYHYIMTDHLGHTRVVVDQNKKLIQETAYYPYGLPINSLSRKSNFNYLYTGKEFLDTLNINWYDHHARYYDPEVARWWSIDPRIVSASPYMAMYNTPNMAVDPDGEMPFLVALAVQTAFNWLVGVANNTINNGMSFKNAIANTPISIGMSVNSAGQLSNPIYEQYKILRGVGLAATNLNMQIANYSGIDPPVDDQWNGSAVRNNHIISKNTNKIFLESPNDSFIDIELNLKFGLAWGENIKLFGIGEEVMINAITFDYMSFKWASNSKGIRYTPYKSAISSIQIGAIGLYGGIEQDWSKMSTNPNGQLGVFSLEKKHPMRINLINFGYMFGVGYDFKVTMSPAKFFNSYIKYQTEWYDEVGWSIHSMSH